MKSSGISPTGKAQRSGDWSKGKAPFVHDYPRRADPPGAASDQGGGDTSSFSELMRLRLRETADGSREDPELRGLIYIVSSGTERIRLLAQGLADPLPTSDAHLDSARTRAALQRYSGYQARGYK